jgi:arginyl-tRNA synthetase
MDFAASFHSVWNKGNDNASLRFIVPADLALTRARCALIKSVQTVLQSGLAVMGCPPVEEMRNESVAA